MQHATLSELAFHEACVNAELTAGNILRPLQELMYAWSAEMYSEYVGHLHKGVAVSRPVVQGILHRAEQLTEAVGRLWVCDPKRGLQFAEQSCVVLGYALNASSLTQTSLQKKEAHMAENHKDNLTQLVSFVLSSFKEHIEWAFRIVSGKHLVCLTVKACKLSLGIERIDLA